MQTKMIVIAAACFVGGAAIEATMTPASAQSTAQPGQATQGRVWIQNRGRAEAVPVDLANANLERPLHVQIANGDPNQQNPVIVRNAREIWEYKSILVTADDAARGLNGESANGWETTGIAFGKPDGSAQLILRRLR
jgi:hypothetical protein